MKQDLESIVKNDLFLEAKLLDKIASGEYTPDMATTAFWNANLDYAMMSFFTHNDITKAKMHLNTCGCIDEFMITRYNDCLLDFGIHHICLPILSDNEPLIQRYAKLRYSTTYVDGRTDQVKPLTMDEMVLKGESTIGCNTIQFFMENNKVGIERNLNLFDLYKTKILRMGKTVELDFEFFKALLNNDKAKMEELLEKLVSPKVLKRKFDNPIFNQYIALPALGYAKLAWRKGIEVDINHPLIPKQLLPIQPLDHYEIPYDFLK